MKNIIPTLVNHLNRPVSVSHCAAVTTSLSLQ